MQHTDMNPLREQESIKSPTALRDVINILWKTWPKAFSQH